MVSRYLISHRLHQHDTAQYTTRDSHMSTKKDHDAWNDLSKEVENDEECAEEVATIPRGIHIGSLLVPLIKHADAILQESRDET